MNDQEARKHLESSLDCLGEIFSDEKIESVVWFLRVEKDDEDATLDGEFTADDLEAIARWMRNPSLASAGVEKG